MLACTCICATRAHLLPEDKPKDGITFLETKVTDGWKLPCFHGTKPGSFTKATIALTSELYL